MAQTKQCLLILHGHGCMPTTAPGPTMLSASSSLGEKMSTACISWCSCAVEGRCSAAVKGSTESTPP